MVLIGLVILSVSVALLFEGLQEIPLTYIKPANGFEWRLCDGFRSTYVLGKLGKVLDMGIPEEQHTTAQTTPIPTGILTPMPTEADHVVEPTMTRSFIEPRALIEIPDHSQVGKIEGFLESFKTFFFDSKNIFPQALIFIIYAGAVLLLLRAARTYFLFAYTIWKRGGLYLTGRATHGGIDKVDAEFELQRYLLLSKMDLIQASAGVFALLKATDGELKQRMATITTTFAQCSKEVLEECVLLKEAAHGLKTEYTTWPTRDELLRDYIENFKDSLTAAKDDLDSEIDRLKNLIPNFTEEFHRTVRRLDANLLGSLPMVYLKERRLLESNIQTIREAMNQLPYLGSLENEVALASTEMENIQTQMRGMVADSREALRNTVCIHQEIDELKDKLRYLEEELAPSRLAPKSANINKKGFRDIPKLSIVGLPTNALNDFGGETSNTDYHGDANYDMRQGLKKHGKVDESDIESFPSSLARSVTSSELSESLLRALMVEDPADIHGKGRWNIDEDASSSVSISPQYPPCKERNMLWSSSLESDSEIEEECSGEKQLQSSS
ncbi:conserved hypothetical protein [Histoplasma capsulatum var. duboisii H88]|uniref:Regulatory protein n=1 Tax=Ajellomyces capsulatus (strain H88) TaxID=544711 RepID=F0U7C9_AJEC8|nr:conserved hypothetical protein [Histoplasma capsulatum var. duboisii H88]QSS51204.1 regulatory protein [Histoplasma capsulatum var. duboisii H88]